MKFRMARAAVIVSALAMAMPSGTMSAQNTIEDHVTVKETFDNVANQMKVTLYGDDKSFLEYTFGAVVTRADNGFRISGILVRVESTIGNDLVGRGDILGSKHEAIGSTLQSAMDIIGNRMRSQFLRTYYERTGILKPQQSIFLAGQFTA